MREYVNLNEKWAFTKSSFKDLPREIPKDWYFVNLPHTWNAIDGQDGGNDYFRGRCLYAKRINKSDLPKAERYFLEIGGANSSADVYINGEHLMHHDGGYSLWRVDITDSLSGNDLLIIAVDNSHNDEVYPQMADFTFYGGLYRNVRIICTPDSHFELEHHGTPGLKITPKIDGGTAYVEIETWIKDMRDGQRIRYTIFDKDGTPVTSITTKDTKVILNIPDVVLWQGRKNPYLYVTKLELCRGEDVLDIITAHFGCRSFEVDPERGFILNGEEYPLRGVSRHQDRYAIGNALLPEHQREDMELIDELGATTVRLAHYQHDGYFYDLCDERGIVVWAEIPYISRHVTMANKNTAEQMKELITQNYNHPSIAFWGLSNEITMNGDKDPEFIENHKRLNELCHAMDKTRLTCAAVVSPCPIDSPYIDIPDLISYNHYFGWYGGDVSMNGEWFDNFRRKNPDIPIGCSEYGAEALNWHTSNPVQGDYTEEYQAYYHEEMIKQLFSRKYLWATHVWNMFDFGADARAEGGEDGQNHKGLVTFDRRYKKDAFFAYKAWLSKEPFVHICGKRYVDRPENVTRVTVYSNLPEVELFASGKSLGKKSAPDHFFRFEVPNSGVTELVATAGKYSDEAKIKKVNGANDKYRLKDKHAVLNWFDIEELDGALSLNDKIDEIKKHPEGAALLEDIFGRLTSNKNAAFAGFEFSEEMTKMIGGFTLLRLLGMMGGMSGAAPTKEELLDINKKLLRIKK